MTALRKAHTNFISANRPFRPCTGVFTATTGLPCAHKIDEYREHKVSLRPSDFHLHWYWDRYIALSAPTLDPIRVITYSRTQAGTQALAGTQAPARTQVEARTRSTKRIPSGFEATEPHERRCGQCRLPGHTKRSIRCMINIRRQNQELELASDRFAQSANRIMELDFDLSEDLHTNSQLQSIAQIAGQQLESGSNTRSVSNNPESTTIEVDTRPIWPGRPELIYQAYLAEKEAWLAANPAVLPAQYRNKRGLTRWSESWCRQHKKFLPYQRLDLQSETLILGDPNWSYEELRAWLDWDEKKQEEADQEAEAELITAGGFGRVRKDQGLRGGMSRIMGGVAAENRMYRFIN